MDKVKTELLLQIVNIVMGIIRSLIESGKAEF